MTMQTTNRNIRFTGRHMATILVVGFGFVIAVNVLMARLAVGTFGGVVVENSYVASQDFNRWLDEAAREKTLGWTAAAVRRTDGRLLVTLAGAPATARLSGDARHPLGREQDIALTFAAQGPGRYISREPVPAGRWTLRLTVRGGGHIWRTEAPLS